MENKRTRFISDVNEIVNSFFPSTQCHDPKSIHINFIFNPGTVIIPPLRIATSNDTRVPEKME